MLRRWGVGLLHPPLVVFTSAPEPPPMSERDVIANQKRILQNQKAIITNQNQIKANQETIKKNQATILKNQGSLGTIIKNQKQILAAVKK
jgi:hypothetical protein